MKTEKYVVNICIIRFICNNFKNIYFYQTSIEYTIHAYNVILNIFFIYVLHILYWFIIHFNYFIVYRKKRETLLKTLLSNEKILLLS